MVYFPSSSHLRTLLAETFLQRKPHAETSILRLERGEASSCIYVNINQEHIYVQNMLCQ